MFSIKVFTALVALIPLISAQTNNTGFTIDDLPGHDITKVDLSKLPPPACPELDVFHWDGGGSVALENMGRTLRKGMKKQVPAAEVTGVFYDSFDPVFENCIQAGAKAANAVLKGRVALCPNTSIALSGYSLGAATIHAMQLDPEVIKRIVAISTYGDPIKVPQINMGRLDFPILDKECVINFCNKNDYFCYGSPNQNDWTPHWAYVRDGTGEKAAKAIAKCYKKAKKANKVYSS